jgi:transcriptional regulator with XRE-family HTH domain
MSARSPNQRSPNETDVYIGRRLRMLRLERGFSQTEVADRLGVTFQQIQKYERGANRVGAGRLQEIANVFSVTPGFFFEEGPRAKSGKSEKASEAVELLGDKYNLALAQAFNKIRSRSVQRNVLEFVEDIAKNY